MCKLNEGMDRGGHYDVEMKGGCQRWYYDVQIKRANGQGRAL